MLTLVGSVEETEGSAAFGFCGVVGVFALVAEFTVLPFETLTNAVEIADALALVGSSGFAFAGALILAGFRIEIVLAGIAILGVDGIGERSSGEIGMTHADAFNPIRAITVNAGFGGTTAGASFVPLFTIAGAVLTDPVSVAALAFRVVAPGADILALGAGERKIAVAISLFLLFIPGAGALSPAFVGALVFAGGSGVVPVADARGGVAEPTQIGCAAGIGIGAVTRGLVSTVVSKKPDVAPAFPVQATLPP
jgi:hypothetical protein